MKAFVIKYEEDYSRYNVGKSHEQRKRNKRLGKRKMNARLKREILMMDCDL